MEIYFECTFESQTKDVKRFLKENNYILTSKCIKTPRTIIVDTITKEYKYDTSSYMSSVHVSWLFKAMLNSEFIKN